MDEKFQLDESLTATPSLRKKRSTDHLLQLFNHSPTNSPPTPKLKLPSKTINNNSPSRKRKENDDETMISYILNHPIERNNLKNRLFWKQDSKECKILINNRISLCFGLFIKIDHKKVFINVNGFLDLYFGSLLLDGENKENFIPGIAQVFIPDKIIEGVERVKWIPLFAIIYFSYEANTGFYYRNNQEETVVAYLCGFKFNVEE